MTVQIGSFHSPESWFGMRDLGPMFGHEEPLPIQHAIKPQQRRRIISAASQASARWMQDGRYACQIRGTSRGPRWAALHLGINHHGALGAIRQYRKRECFALYSALGCKMIHVGRNA
jgi:hypothetical protein